MKKYIIVILFLFSIKFLIAQESPRVTGQLIVQAKSEKDLKTIINQLRILNGQETKLKIEKELSQIMQAWLLSFDEENTPIKLIINELNRKPAISIVQYNHLVNLRSTLPNDPNFGTQWHHVNDGAGSATEDADIDSDLAWDITTGGLTATNDSIVVCVVEGGNLEHTDLQANAWRNYAEIPNNDIDDDFNGFIDDYLGWNVQSNNDQGLFGDGHGTQVAGMIGAKGNNDLLVSGINWNVKIMVVGGEDANDEASVIAAYNYPLVMRKLYNETNGAQGAFVVATNASWGIDYGDPNDIPLWCAFYDTLGTYGILSCGATANAQINVDIDGDIPTGCTSPYMISVTATNNQDVRTFSAYGLTTIDLGAPGENVVTTNGNSTSGSTSGTSFASPLTAGVIGLLYAAPCNSFMQTVKVDPQTGADIVRNALLNGVDIVDDLVGYTVTGGRLNANNSLLEIINNCNEDGCFGGYNLTVMLSEDSLFKITWGIFNDTNTYNIRYRISSDTEWIEINNVSGDVFFIGTQEYREIEGVSLAYCTNYEFEIAATCDSNFTGNVSTYSFQTTGCCTAPTQFGFVSIDDTSVNLNWQNVFGSTFYQLEYRIAGETDYILVEEIVGDTYGLENLQACTEYQARLKTLCADSSSASYSDFSFFTKGCGACDSVYCVSVGQNSSDEFIESIQIGDYVNQSGNNDGYGEFVNSGLIVNTESSYPITLTAGFPGQDFSENFSCWIDFNKNGEFDSEELVFSENLVFPVDFVEGLITIPTNAISGITKLRVVMKYYPSIPSTLPCEEFQFGETEDYCIEILQAVGLNEKENNTDAALLFPNPAADFLTVTLKQTFGIKNVISVYDVAGRLMSKNLLYLGDNKIDVSDFAEGLYTFEIGSENKVTQQGSFAKL